jgi:hypothetical protein
MLLQPTKPLLAQRLDAGLASQSCDAMLAARHAVGVQKKVSDYIFHS